MILHKSLLFDDINEFNRRLNQYLHWYNCKQVYAGFENKITPYNKFMELTKNSKIHVK